MNLEGEGMKQLEDGVRNWEYEIIKILKTSSNAG